MLKEMGLCLFLFIWDWIKPIGCRINPGIFESPTQFFKISIDVRRWIGTTMVSSLAALAIGKVGQDDDEVAILNFEVNEVLKNAEIHK